MFIAVINYNNQLEEVFISDDIQWGPDLSISLSEGDIEHIQKWVSDISVTRSYKKIFVATDMNSSWNKFNGCFPKEFYPKTGSCVFMFDSWNLIRHPDDQNHYKGLITQHIREERLDILLNKDRI